MSEEILDQVENLTIAESQVEESPASSTPAEESTPAPAEESTPAPAPVEVSSPAEPTPVSPSPVSPSEEPKKRLPSFGGGGVKCTKCVKTSYPAETIQFEMKPYHMECFTCKTCKKKMEPFQAAQFDGELFCRICFQKEGLHKKQAEVKWNATESAPAESRSRGVSSFGGGGMKCTTCDKTSYPAETIQFEMKPYHAKCFCCVTCKKELDAPNAAKFEEKIYCRNCFLRDGLNRKQAATTTWTGTSESSESPAHRKTVSTSFGGGGMKCTTCDKTSYPAETIQFEMKPYHAKCFCCVTCKKELDAPNAAKFEEKIYCRNCFLKDGLNRKQAATTTWTGSSETATATTPKPSIYGGGGNKCTICEKTAYPAETIQFEMKPYHVKCFFCITCKKELDAPNAAKFEEKIYCRNCFLKDGLNRKQATTSTWTGSSEPTSPAASTSKPRYGGGGFKCDKCTLTVYAGEAMKFNDKMFHPKCFTCGDCSKDMGLPEANQFENKLVCRACWAKGRYNEKQLEARTRGASASVSTTSSGTSRYGGGGEKCVVCTKTVYPAETIKFENRMYHDKCFRCCHCTRVIELMSQADNKDDQVYCRKCFMELGLWQADK